MHHSITSVAELVSLNKPTCMFFDPELLLWRWLDRGNSSEKWHKMTKSKLENLQITSRMEWKKNQDRQMTQQNTWPWIFFFHCLLPEAAFFNNYCLMKGFLQHLVWHQCVIRSGFGINCEQVSCLLLHIMCAVVLKDEPLKLCAAVVLLAFEIWHLQQTLHDCSFKHPQQPTMHLEFHNQENQILW